MKAHENNYKRNKKDKTAAYKKKRIQEATSLYDQFCKKVTEIEKQLKEPDECFATEKAEFQQAYKTLMESLLAIPAEDNEQERSNNEDTVLTAAIKVQEVRFETIRRNLADIDKKLATDTTGEAISQAYATLKKAKLTELWNRVEQEDEKMDQDETSDEYNNNYMLLEEQVEQSLVMLEETLQKLNAKTEGVKLNPKFYGDYFKWITFRDLFKTMVMENKGMSNSQKMQVLKTSVGGEAETLINDLTISEVNLQGAWDKLMHRYDNNKVVVHQLLNKIMSQQGGKGDAKSMKKLLDTTDQVLLALKNLGRPVEQWDDWIIVIITQKFSEDHQKDCERKTSESNELSTWKELKTFMENQFHMMERLENGSSGNRRAEYKGRSTIKAYQRTNT